MPQNSGGIRIPLRAPRQMRMFRSTGSDASSRAHAAPHRLAARQGDRNDLCRRLRRPLISDVRDLLEFLQGPQHR
jgi:hypothetical protein